MRREPTSPIARFIDKRLHIRHWSIAIGIAIQIIAIFAIRILLGIAGTFAYLDLAQQGALGFFSMILIGFIVTYGLESIYVERKRNGD